MNASVCPKCGKPLSSDAPQSLCPECLLKAALPGQSALTSSGDAQESSETTIGPAAGTSLKYFGDYELLEEIARGGMGVVWKARQKSLNREVALKMIRAGALASPEEVQRFLREAEAAANLQHPNIVAIHEVGEHDGQHYFSMDLVVGRDLGALVKDGPLTPQRAASYVKIIAAAIHFAHQRGTLHRDLKPQNVLIDAADQPRITDFGLAKIMKDDSRLTQTGVVMGSPSYMPPEQAAGRMGEVGPASDVYSMGAMLYELLTGKPPFRGATAMATLRDVMENEPEELRRLKADIPVDLETICLKCLEKSPTARYPSARALAEELDRFLKGEPIQARPASSVRKAVSWARRHPGVLAGLATFVMVTLGLGVFYLLEENAFLRSEKPEERGLIRVAPGRPGEVLKPNELAVLPGQRTESMKVWSSISALVTCAGIYFWMMLRFAVRGVPIKQVTMKMLVDPGVHLRPLQPLGDTMRTLAVCAGLAVTACSLALLVYTIQAHVWEMGPIFTPALQVYAGAYFGIAILALVIRDYRLVQYGTVGPASPQLTAEQAASIRATMEQWDWKGAIKLYREALPEASKSEATMYVLSLGNSLRADNPGKFASPPFDLANLGWTAMLVCTPIEAGVLGVGWYRDPPAVPLVAVVLFAYCFLAGMASMAVWRVEGMLKKALVLFSALLAAVLGEVLLGFALGASWRAEIGEPLMRYYMAGYFGGIFLMGAGMAGEVGRALHKKLAST